MTAEEKIPCLVGSGQGVFHSCTFHSSLANIPRGSGGVKPPAVELKNQSGITAVASISTSQSGRASAVTTTPVETGCTPLIYSPMVR